MLLYYDDLTAREIADNLIQYDRTKHIEIERHSIKEKWTLKLVDIPFLWASEQPPYILGHAFSAKVLKKSLGKLGLEDIFAPSWGGVLTND